MRVFTAIPKLHASEEERKLLEEEVAKTSITTQEVGGLKESDLSPKGALLQPGNLALYLILWYGFSKVDDIFTSVQTIHWDGRGR